MTVNELENTLRVDENGSFLSGRDKTRHITGMINDFFYEIKADISYRGARFEVGLYHPPKKTTRSIIIIYSHLVRAPLLHSIRKPRQFECEFDFGAEDKDLSWFLKEDIRNLELLKGAYKALEEMHSSGYLARVTEQVRSEEEKAKKVKVVSL